MAPITDEHDPRVRSELAAGERLVWFGHPDPRAYARRSWSIFWFGVAFACFAVFWMATAFAIMSFADENAVRNDDRAGRIMEYFPLFGIPFLLVGLGLMTAPIWWRGRARKTCYAITDRRVVIWRIDFFIGLEVRSYSAEHLMRMIRREHDNGCGDLIFEEIVEHYTDSEGSRCTRTIERGFIGIADVREIERLIRVTLVPGVR